MIYTSLRQTDVTVHSGGAMPSFVSTTTAKFWTWDLEDGDILIISDAHSTRHYGPHYLSRPTTAYCASVMQVRDYKEIAHREFLMKPFSPPYLMVHGEPKFIQPWGDLWLFSGVWRLSVKNGIVEWTKVEGEEAELLLLLTEDYPNWGRNHGLN